MGRLTQTASGGALDWAVGTNAEREWSQRVGALCLFPGLLSELGVDPQLTLTSVGLPASSLDSPDNRIPYSALGRLLTESARRAGRPYLGLLVGQLWTLGHMGLVGQLMKHSSTIGDALRTLAVFHRLNSDGGTVFLSKARTWSLWAMRSTSPMWTASSTSTIRSWYAAATTFANSSGRIGIPSRLCLRAHGRSILSRIETCFRARLEFDSDHTAMYLPRRLLDQPVPGADPKTRRQLEAKVEAATATDLLVRLHRALRLLLLTGGSSGDYVAQQLSMHRRTLHRRLKAQGTTFQQVLDGVRWDISRQLLGNTKLSLE